MSEKVLVPREPTYEDVKRSAIALCRAAGHDPFGPTCDVYVEDDPDAGTPWAGYRKQARAAWSAMIAASPSSPPVGEGWQPIETAPKDGTRFVAWGFVNDRSENGPLRTQTPVPHVMQWREYATSGGDWVSTSLSTAVSQHPTHWMPLPPPPALLNQTEER